MSKKIRAISFDNAREINTLVSVLKRASSAIEQKYYTEDERIQIKKLLSVTLEVQQMFFEGEKDAINK
tara:strand:+ start:16779 stop:16982 length:204 start_codon:yes stop_codon:yes gene_type:complete